MLEIISLDFKVHSQDTPKNLASFKNFLDHLGKGFLVNRGP